MATLRLCAGVYSNVMPAVVPLGQVAATELALAVTLLEAVVREAAADPELPTKTLIGERGTEGGGASWEGRAVVIGKGDYRIRREEGERRGKGKEGAVSAVFRGGRRRRDSVFELG